MCLSCLIQSLNFIVKPSCPIIRLIKWALRKWSLTQTAVILKVVQWFIQGPLAFGYFMALLVSSLFTFRMEQSGMNRGPSSIEYFFSFISAWVGRYLPCGAEGDGSMVFLSLWEVSEELSLEMWRGWGTRESSASVGHRRSRRWPWEI